MGLIRAYAYNVILQFSGLAVSLPNEQVVVCDLRWSSSPYPVAQTTSNKIWIQLTVTETRKNIQHNFDDAH